jgi:ABC-type transport system involved in Fe-S cluster assembly fused permease/ATPase subunit
VYQVSNGTKTAGDFAMLLAYWSQLTSPLRFFAGLGKSISQDLVSAERLLEVMLTKPTVVERPDAKPLNLSGGRIEFRKVSFSYDKKKDILNGVNLLVPAGKTAAFVGATGAGKSTILKLLNRFYDVTGGSVLIDGQDIRDVQLSR